MPSQRGLQEMLLEEGLSSNVVSSLLRYCQIVMRMNENLNLFGPGDELQFGRRHLLDAVRARGVCPPRAEALIDVGSGGGIPGVVLALIGPSALRVFLVERIQKKARALRVIVEELGLADRVCVVSRSFDEAIKDLPAAEAEIWVRAVAPAPELAKYMSRHFEAWELGPIFLMKGPNWSVEAKEVGHQKNLSKDWRARFESAELFHYELPEKAGSRVLVVVPELKKGLAKP